MRSRTATATTVNAVRPSGGVEAAMAEGEERNLEDESLQVTDEKVDDTGSEADASDEEAGVRFTKKMQNPLKPGQHEISEHEKTHLPFRNWCRHRIRVRGREMPHFRSQDKPGLPEVHFDFGFWSRRMSRATRCRLCALGNA